MEIMMKALLAVALAVAALPAHGQSLSLEDALRAGEGHSPRLAAQRHALEASQEQTVRATELPDPRLKLGIQNLPVTGPAQLRYDLDFMTQRVVGVMQEVPNADKRAARGLRATRARDLEAGLLTEQRAFLRRDIAAAWLEALFAERGAQALRRLSEQLAAQSEAASPALVRGRQGAAEGLGARAALEQARDRELEQERLVERARLNLAALIGDEARLGLGAAPDLDRLQGREALLQELAAHPHLRSYDLREDLARAEVDLARSERKSDWAVEVEYGQRKPYFDNMISINFTFQLPWRAEKRQDRDIASRAAELERVRAQREDARRMHEAELRGFLADYDAGTRRLARFRDTLVPLARERAEAALAAYRGGRGELLPLLDAQRGVTEAELAALAIEAERAKAWASLTYLYPHGDHQ
jgi:outer membrane protein TolC